MKMLLASGDSEGGFYVLERSRARDLLRMLAERDLVFSSEIPSDVQNN